MTGARGGRGGPSFSGSGAGLPTSFGPRDNGKGRWDIASMRLYISRCGGIKTILGYEQMQLMGSEQFAFQNNVHLWHVDDC